MLIHIIAGARPNFIKIASLIHAIENVKKPIKYRLVHTGQHYHKGLSKAFFDDFNLPEPDINFNTGSGTASEQTGAIMIAYEKFLLVEKPDFCIVVGDVTSSMACAVTAKKMKVRVVHIEAGLRSYDWNMPEEINRVIIDSIADYLFTTTQNAANLLIGEGKSNDQIFFVGNTMIDTLLKFQSKFKKPPIWDDENLKHNNYLVLTLHRPSNVDDPSNLKKIIDTIISNTKNLPIIFPVHPRTLKFFDSLEIKGKICPTEPMSYLEFNYLVKHSKAVITDSGGITEETTVLGIPCITLRNNTERPETVNLGTNELVGTNTSALISSLEKLFNNNWKKGSIPEKWDGKAGERIITLLSKTLI